MLSATGTSTAPGTVSRESIAAPDDDAEEATERNPLDATRHESLSNVSGCARSIAVRNGLTYWNPAEHVVAPGLVEPPVCVRARAVHTTSWYLYRAQVPYHDAELRAELGCVQLPQTGRERRCACSAPLRHTTRSHNVTKSCDKSGPWV